MIWNVDSKRHSAFPEPAPTIATMPALIASGSSGQAAKTASLSHGVA